MQASEVGGAAGVKSAQRALAVVEYVAGAGPVTFAEVVGALGLPRSSAHGLLHTLQARGWLEKGSDGRFALGLRSWEVGQQYGGHRELVDVARPVMETLVGELEETVQLAQLDGVENVYIAISHSPHPIRLASSVGARLPAHATGIGKALLASLPAEEARRRLGPGPLTRLTPNTVTDVPALLGLVDEARARGFATDEEESWAGCVCVAAPVGCDPTRPAAPVALSVTIPTSRAREPWPESYLPPLLRAAAEIRAEARLEG